MEVRKTTLFIGNSEEDRKMVLNAIKMSGNQSNFLALETCNRTTELLKKSQPFWYNYIFVDVQDTSVQTMSVLRTIKSIRHLCHIPVIAYCSRSINNDLNLLLENGAAHILLKPAEVDSLSSIFSLLKKRESLPFVLNYPLGSSVQQGLKRAS